MNTKSQYGFGKVLRILFDAVGGLTPAWVLEKSDSFRADSLPMRLIHTDDLKAGRDLDPNSNKCLRKYQSDKSKNLQKQIPPS